MLAVQSPSKDQYVSSMRLLLEEMEKVQHLDQSDVITPGESALANKLPPIGTIVESTKQQEIIPCAIPPMKYESPCSLQQLSRMIGDALAKPPLCDYESPYYPPLAVVSDLPTTQSEDRIVLPSIQELENTVAELRQQEQSLLGKRKRSERKLSITRTTMNDFEENPSKRTKFDQSPERDWNVLSQGKQLICTGKIRRKNNKILPQDSYQMKWTLK
jgi:hypothetical protein